LQNEGPQIQASIEKLKVTESRFRLLIEEGLNGNINYEEVFASKEAEFLKTQLAAFTKL
jgi:hypothetical protein